MQESFSEIQFEYMMKYNKNYYCHKYIKNNYKNKNENTITITAITSTANESIAITRTISKST